MFVRNRSGTDKYENVLTDFCVSDLKINDVIYILQFWRRKGENSWFFSFFARWVPIGTSGLGPTGPLPHLFIYYTSDTRASWPWTSHWACVPALDHNEHIAPELFLLLMTSLFTFYRCLLSIGVYFPLPFFAFVLSFFYLWYLLLTLIHTWGKVR